ncbi:putative electron transfer flavoprotein subunit [Dissophora ornata]|nr:putative electron transfer flavoprotein subunit [Dissophora ornata]
MQQSQILEQQSKRRKISDAEPSVLVKSEPTEGPQQQQQQQQRLQSHLKPLLPHPPTRQERPLLPQSQHAVFRPRARDTEAADPSEADDEVEEGDDQDDMDEDAPEESCIAERDVEMMEAHAEREMSEDGDSGSDSDSDYDEHHQRENDAASDTEDVGAKDTAKGSDTTMGSSQSKGKNNSGTIIECANCGQTQTPLWRKDAKGQSICNACGLYARLHQRDRPITMRKSKITRRKREWNSVQDKESVNNNSADIRSNANMCARKRKEKPLSDGHVEMRSMNIPVSSGHESDESSLCFLEQRNGDHVHLPTPASNASLSPIMSASMSTMAIGSGSLSPALTASPPTPALTHPHFLNTSSSFPSLNPLLIQQYQQHLQSQAAFSAAASAATTPTTEGLPMLSNSWLSQLYPQYPATSFLNSSTLPRDPAALAELQLQQQQSQQQHPQQQPSPFQTKASSPVSPVSLTSASSFSPTRPAPIITSAQSLQNLQKQHQHQHGSQKKGQSPLILDSTRFTRLMNQMSKPQLSMFLTILEERCGALRHRLSGEDDQVGRVDTNEMMMLLNTPQFSSMEGGLTGHSSGGSGASHGIGAAAGMTASAALLAAMNELNGQDHQDRSDFMM